jgi:hypothetical protein
MLQVEIRVKEHLNHDWSEWLEGFTIIHVESGESVLIGTVRDQAALRGLLDRLADLGLQLSSVTAIEAQEAGEGS